MNIKLVGIDVDTGNPVFQEQYEGLADGTVGGALLMWNASAATWQELKYAANSYIYSGYNSSEYIFLELVKGSGLVRIRAQDSYNGNREAILVLSGGLERFRVNQDGSITSNPLTANTYLGTNASKKIVSIPSPNLIKGSSSTDLTDSIGEFRDAGFMEFVAEPSVTYELTFKLAFGNVAMRNGSVRIFGDGTPFTYRPFVLGNFSSGAPNVIYVNDSTVTQPFNMDNGNVLDFQTSGDNSVYELKGLFTTPNNIARVRLQFKTRDIGMPLVLKAYSYLKLSR